MEISHQNTFTNNKIELKVTLTGTSREMTGIYFTGDQLTANVHLKVKFPTKAVKFVFQCVGISKLGNVRKCEFKKSRYFIGDEKSKKLQTIKTGEYNHQVSIELPENLLPTVRCKNHFVRYYCQAKIVRMQARNTLRSGMQSFAVYQNNANSMNLVPELQMPEDYEKIYKKLRFTYQLRKSGLYLGESPIIAGEIYNSGNSMAKLRVGIDIHQTAKVNGDMNLIVTTLKMNDENCIEQFGCWSDLKTIEPSATENFSAEIPLRALPPTTHSLNVDITYEVVLKICIERSLTFLKPKTKYYTHNITIARRPDGRTPMKRSVSRVSIGKTSVKRISPPSKPPLHDMFGEGASGISSPSSRYYDSPPPSYAQ